MKPPSLSRAQARRVAISAAGLAAPAPTLAAAGATLPGGRAIMAHARRLGVVQLDSVNVFARAHYLPLFSRLGTYDTTQLDALAAAPKRGLFEYWPHEAGFIPVETWPIWRTRMAARAQDPGRWHDWADANGEFVTWLYDYVRDHRRTTAGEIEHERNRRQGSWWGWSDVKTGLEWLFRIGAVTSDGRKGFQRRYTLPERVIPAALLDADVPVAEANRQLVETAARNLGVFTLADAADYFRMRTDDARDAIMTLADAGTIVPVAVEGWRDPAWLRSAQPVPRHTAARALVSPFDPLVWFRPRTYRLFDFHYRIEIYTPAPKRIYGYYTLPFVLGESIVGRVDLKSDRDARVLRVPAAWAEPSAPDETAAALADTLREAAAWQGLDEIDVGDAGNIAAPLRAALEGA